MILNVFHIIHLQNYTSRNEQKTYYMQNRPCVIRVITVGYNLLRQIEEAAENAVKYNKK